MAEEFPANVLPWRRTAEQTGAMIDTIARSAQGDWTAAVLEGLRPGVRVVALPNCHWTDGARFDLAAIGARCRQIDAALVVDATQSLGAMPLDLDAVDPDFVVAAGYKWLLCPYGFGLMYASRRWQHARPLEESWLARAGAEDFANLVDYSDVYRPGARRFDVSETCVGTILPGAIAALEQLQAWGVGRLADSLAAINARIAGEAETLGFQVPLARAPHMFGARLPLAYGGDLVATLRERGVHVSRRGQSVRFAPHLHVTEADLAQLCAALEAAVRHPVRA
jgi:selenocysteine lyase/cysteine desulfurase